MHRYTARVLRPLVATPVSPALFSFFSLSCTRVTRSQSSLFATFQQRSFARGPNFPNAEEQDREEEREEEEEEEEYDESLRDLDRPESIRSLKGSKEERAKLRMKAKKQTNEALQLKLSKRRQESLAARRKGSRSDGTDELFQAEMDDETSASSRKKPPSGYFFGANEVEAAAEDDYDTDDDVEDDLSEEVPTNAKVGFTDIPKNVPSTLTIPPVNEKINGSPIMLIDGSGKRLGLVALDVALAKVRSQNLDLMQLSPPEIKPPVCKVVNFAMWLKAETLKAEESAPVVKREKMLRLRPAIAAHDLEIKMNQAIKFLNAGHAVRIVFFSPNAQPDAWQPFFKDIANRLAAAGHPSTSLEINPFVIFSPGAAKKSSTKPGGKAAASSSKQQPKSQAVAA